VNREQVVKLCQRMIAEKIGIKWTCNSCINNVDEEMLGLMSKAGCWYISRGIESGNEQILRHVHKGAYLDKAKRALSWPKMPVKRIGVTSLSACLAKLKRR